MSKRTLVIQYGSAVILLMFLVGLSLKSAFAQSAPNREPIGANDARFDRVRSKIQELMLNARLPSVAVAVAQNGKIVWEQGFGWADREQLRPATADTMYSLASISKPFTATAIMALVKQGKLKLDAPANDYLGAAKMTGFAGDASGATIRRLLNHTSGLPLHWHFIYSNESYVCPPMDDTIVRYGKLVNPPGKYFSTPTWALAS